MVWIGILLGNRLRTILEESPKEYTTQGKTRYVINT